MGALSDGLLVSSDFCGKGTVEIEWPFCHHFDTISNIAKEDSHFRLIEDCNDELRLDQGNAYYYQVQSQIWLCSADYCDFYVRTLPESNEGASLHIERILPNESFLAIMCWLVCPILSNMCSTRNYGKVVLTTNYAKFQISRFH